MKKLLIFACIIIAGIGFYKLSPKDQDQVKDTGSAAVGAVGKMMGAGWSVLRQQAQGLSSNSETAELEKTKADLTKLRDDLKKKNAKANAATIKELDIQIDRLDSAIKIKQLKREMDEKVEAASKLKENSEKSVDDVKKKLAEADASYKDLQKKLNAAQTSYDKTSKSLGL